MDHEINPFLILGGTDDIRQTSIPGYGGREFEGKEFRPDDQRIRSLRLTLDVNRLRLFLLLVAASFVILAGRLWLLQIHRGTTYALAAEGNRTRIVTIPADRGIITDRHGQPLVRNVPAFRLQIIPGDLPDDPATREELLRTISSILGQSFTEFSAIIDASTIPFQPVTVADQFDHETAIRLTLAADDVSGVSVESTATRDYLNPAPFAHTLGYLSRIPEGQMQTYLERGYQFSDFLGVSGAEATYESVLKGRDGRRHIEVDSIGRVRKTIASEPPVAGRTVQLSIDARLQGVLYSALEKKVNDLHVSGGSAVAIDPRNGAIRALVNVPSFDNNVFVSRRSTDELNRLFNDERKPLLNRAISGEYPSGSTIKPVIAAAALAEGIISRSTTFLSTGGIRINQWFFPDWKAGGHGVTNVIRALADSINTFFYIIGGGYEETAGLGVDRIRAYAEKFGLNHTLGIDLPGEQAGFLPTKEWKEETKREAWYIGDTYHLAIGQGDLLVTPLQLATAMAAVVNGGTLYQPHIAERIINPENPADSEAIDPVILGSTLVAANHLQTVRDGLREAVTNGSAARLADLSVPAGGKTGTAQFGDGNQTHSWFMGFAPFDNPEIVVVVLVEAGGEGGTAALPVAKEFLQAYFQ